MGDTAPSTDGTNRPVEFNVRPDTGQRNPLDTINMLRTFAPDALAALKRRSNIRSSMQNPDSFEQQPQGSGMAKGFISGLF